MSSDAQWAHAACSLDQRRRGGDARRHLCRRARLHGSATAVRLWFVVYIWQRLVAAVRSGVLGTAPGCVCGGQRAAAVRAEPHTVGHLDAREARRRKNWVRMLPG